MPRPVKRTHKHKPSTFRFETRKAAPRDTPEQRAEKERLIREFMEKQRESEPAP